MKSQVHIRRIIALVGLALSLIGASSALAQTPVPAQCPGAPVTRLSPNVKGVVTPGAANNVRETAGLSGKLVGQLQGGQVFFVYDGPICADGYVWWHIGADNVYGFTAEGKGSTYYVEPYIPASISTPEGMSASVNQQGIAFRFATSIAPEAAVEALPAYPGEPDGPGWGIAPAGIQFILFDGTERTVYPDSTISIYPAAGFAPLDARTGQELDALKALITNETASSADQIPEVPIINAAQVIRASVKYLTLPGGGKGVRFLTWYAQDMSIASNETLRYEFRGFSGSGAHYITASFRVRSADLPDTVDYSTLYDRFAQEGSYQTYLNTITQQLTAMSANRFTPELDQLDALVQSITFANG